MAADPGLAVQLREQFGQMSATVRHAIAARTGAAATLYDPAAPGAGLSGRITVASVVQDQRDQAGRSRGPETAEPLPAEGGFLLAEDLRSDMLVLALRARSTVHRCQILHHRVTPLAC